MCKREIEFWRRQLEEQTQIREVIQRVWDGEGPTRTHHYQVLKLVQVDAFKDGLRILVE